MKRGKAKEYTVPEPPPGWPHPLGKVAMCGMLGDIVTTIAPYTEADPAALAVQMQVAFGNLIGANPSFKVEATRHHCNLYAVMVGASARGRKGTAMGYVTQLLRNVDPEWATECVQSGLSSGEGLVEAVADGTQDDEKRDKRLLIVEDELSSVLRVMTRPGNTVSTTIRNAWDGRTLQVMTRQAPLRATGAHVSIIAHVTQPDLERYLHFTDLFNGFANRFLWPCTRRSKLLPDGGGINKKAISILSRELRDCVRFAIRQREVGMSANAMRLWKRNYPHLTRDIPGLVGAVTSRAEAQVRRIALVYALMDESEVVRTRHMLAALELWRYCEDSAQFIFGGVSAPALEDKIMLRLRHAENALTRADLNRALGGHVAGPALARALDNLKKQGLARRKKMKTGGRAAEIWSARAPE